MTDCSQWRMRRHGWYSQTRKYDHVTWLLFLRSYTGCELASPSADNIQARCAFISLSARFAPSYFARELTHVPDIESRRHLRSAATETRSRYPINSTPDYWWSRFSSSGRLPLKLGMVCWQHRSPPRRLWKLSDVHLKLNYSREVFHMYDDTIVSFFWLCVCNGVCKVAIFGRYCRINCIFFTLHYKY